MQGQLWRLFEEVAKYSFTISHLKSQDNVLADNNSRRTNLIDLTDEEKELFGDVIEECESQGESGYSNTFENEGRLIERETPKFSKSASQLLRQIAVLSPARFGIFPLLCSIA